MLYLTVLLEFLTVLFESIDLLDTVDDILEYKTEQEKAPSIISNLLSSKLGLSNISSSQARRLGKHKEAQNKPRPILITLPKSHNRNSVVSNRSKLAGSNIYINFDLTKEQQVEEKRL